MAKHKKKPTPEQSRKGRMTREKGAAGEREFADELRFLFGDEDARRGVQYSGLEGKDVVVPALPGVHWEVKRTECLRLYAALQQAIRDAGEDIPVVAHRRNGTRWVIIIQFEDLLRFSEAVYTLMAPGAPPAGG
jgi:hypothetical protein